MSAEELCGGFVIGRNGPDISVSRPGGKWHILSSSGSGGYSESLDSLIITNKPTGRPFEIGVSPDTGTASVVTLTHKMTSVSALVIADAKAGPGDAGDGLYDVAVILMADAELPQATLARAAITSTEAVTCAFQQLLVRDPSSKGLASGSGSICIAVLCNAERGVMLHSAGKHSKLGELIGRSVLEATMSSMGKNGTTPGSQADVFRRLECFGITPASCREYLHSKGLVQGDRFGQELDRIAKDPFVLSCVSSILQIKDAVSWGLIPEKEGYGTGHKIICTALSEEAEESGDLATDIMSALSMEALRNS